MVSFDPSKLLILRRSMACRHRMHQMPGPRIAKLLTFWQRRMKSLEAPVRLSFLVFVWSPIFIILIHTYIYIIHIQIYDSVFRFCFHVFFFSARKKRCHEPVGVNPTILGATRRAPHNRRRTKRLNGKLSEWKWKPCALEKNSGFSMRSWKWNRLPEMVNVYIANWKMAQSKLWIFP